MPKKVFGLTICNYLLCFDYDSQVFKATYILKHNFQSVFMPKLAGLAIKYKSALSSGMTRLSLFLSSGLFDLFNEKRIFPSDPSYGGG